MRGHQGVDVMDKVAVALLFGLASLISCNECELEEELSGHLFEDYIVPEEYSNYMHPNFNKDESMTVYHHVHIESISELHPASMDFSIGYWHTITWVDKRLRWPIGSQAHPLSLDISFAKKIWIPDIMPIVVKQVKNSELFSKQGFLLMYKNSTIMYSLKFNMVVSCPMDLSKYPMDTQNCHLIFEGTISNKSMKHRWTAQPIAYKKSDIDLELPDFNYVIKAKDNIHNYVYEANDYVESVMMEITFSRHLEGHLMQTFVPTIFLVLISCSVYCLPPSFSPHRLIVTVTATLTLSTQLAAVRADLPPMSGVRAIDVWTGASMCVVFCVLTSVCIVTSLRWRHQNLRKLNDENEKMDDSYKRMADTLEKIFRVALPLSFLIFNLFFWIHYAL